MMRRRLRSMCSPIGRWRSTRSGDYGGKTRQYLSLYNYVSLGESDLPRLRRRRLGGRKALGASGLPPEGINAQLVLPESNVQALSTSLPNIFTTKNMKLTVRIRKQSVHDGFETSLQESGSPLPPEEWHQKLKTRSDSDTLVLDVRNFYEHEIGRFDGAALDEILRFLKEQRQAATEALNGSCSEACKQEFMESMTMQQGREYRKQQAMRWMPPIPNALSQYVSKRPRIALSRGLHTRHFTSSRALSKSIDDSALQNDYVYSQSSSLADAALLRELRDETAQTWPKAEQLIDELQGKFLSFLVQTTPAKRVLEIGCFTGYSALCLANGLASDGTLVTCDIDADTMQFAQRFFDRSSRAGQITAVNQDGLEYLNALAASAEQPCDLIFVDANKRKYRAYLDAILEHKLLSPSGLLVFDNTLFRGRVAACDAGLASSKERIARGLAEFNCHVAQHARVSQVLLPLWDGLTLVRQTHTLQRK